MAILRSDFAALTDDLQSIYNEAADSVIAESVGFQIFSVEETERFTHDHVILSGIAGTEEVADGQDYPRGSSEQGDTATFTQRQFGINVPITKRMRKFELYGQMASLVKSVIEEQVHKIDQSLADVLGNGTSTSYTDIWDATVTSTGPDAVALFSASHTNNLNSDTYRNIIRNSAGTNNPALARDPIVEAVKDGMIYADPNGLIRPTKLDTLLVAPTKWDLAERLVFSSMLPGGPDNDINPVKGRIKEVKVWERLETRTGGTDTSEYWYLYDSRKVGESLKVLFAERPSLDAPEEVHDNKDWDYVSDFFYTIGRGYPAYVWQSQGSA